MFKRRPMSPAPCFAHYTPCLVSAEAWLTHFTRSAMEGRDGYELMGGDYRLDHAIAQPLADGKLARVHTASL